MNIHISLKVYIRSFFGVLPRRSNQLTASEYIADVCNRKCYIKCSFESVSEDSGGLFANGG